MTATVIRADARSLPLADASVDLVVTSPPYFALRSYSDGGEHYAGQVGSEPTPAEFIEALLDCTREMVRVLKPTGSIWVNLGDKYNSAKGGQNGTGHTTLSNPDGTSRKTTARDIALAGRGTIVAGTPVKSLILLPERYRIACVDQLGLIARAVVIWSKPNGLPESVNDRVRRSHEDWVHLVKQPRYFAAVDEIREPHLRPKTAAEMARDSSSRRSSLIHAGSRGLARGDAPAARDADDWTPSNPLGKLPGSVWEIATQPLTVPAELGIDHFAAFPMEWPRRIILGWSPSAYCTACGEPRRAFVEATPMVIAPSARRRKAQASGNASRTSTSGTMIEPAKRAITGYACACPEPTAPTEPAVVLDPFGGTGTTALMASVLGRHGISVDMSADYCRLAEWRTTDPGQRAKALQVEAPPKAHEDQLELFEGVAL